MAELIWRAENPQAGGHVATYNSYGATVKIITPPTQSATSPDRGGKGVPAWVRVGQELAAKRIKEYLDATGRMPGEKLLEDFQREMGKRLDAYIREPMQFPFRPMGLREFEEEMEEKHRGAEPGA